MTLCQLWQLWHGNFGCLRITKLNLVRKDAAGTWRWGNKPIAWLAIRDSCVRRRAYRFVGRVGDAVRCDARLVRDVGLMVRSVPFSDFKCIRGLGNSVLSIRQIHIIVA